MGGAGERREVVKKFEVTPLPRSCIAFFPALIRQKKTSFGGENDNVKSHPRSKKKKNIQAMTTGTVQNNLWISFFFLTQQKTRLKDISLSGHYYAL